MHENRKLPPCAKRNTPATNLYREQTVLTIRKKEAQGVDLEKVKSSLESALQRAVKE
jgi:hypothetical protein